MKSKIAWRATEYAAKAAKKAYEASPVYVK